MTLQQQQFLELLRSGLWGTPADPSLFSGNVDWKTILRIAMEQTVQVIVADGIETLPKEFWPPKEAILKLMMVRQKTHQMHQLLNTTLNQIVNALDAEGIPSVLLKGQGVAQNYRNPESRMCGDIDLYVGTDNYKRACDIIERLDRSPEHNQGIESDHHMHLQVNGVEVELHQYADFMPGKKDNQRLNEWTRESIDNHFGTGRLGTWNNGGTKISLPTPTFDAFFILHHAARHMIVEGVGFRQICDWVMYLHNRHKDIDSTELQQKTEAFKMTEIWTEFSILAVDVLGLPAEELPIPVSKNLQSKKTDTLLNHIFKSGNFGKYDPHGRNRHKTTWLKRKWQSLIFQSNRLLTLHELFPQFVASFGYHWFTSAVINFIQKK